MTKDMIKSTIEPEVSSNELVEWIVAITEENKWKEKALERAVTWITAIQSYISDKRDAVDKETHNDQVNTETVKNEITWLIEKKDRWGLLTKASDVIDYFFWSFFWSKSEKKFNADVLFTQIKEMPEEIDFSSMDKTDLEKNIEEFQTLIWKENHLYKRLHYIRCMSRAKDALTQKEGEKTDTPYERLEHSLQDWDLILFWNNGDFWNGKLTSKTKNPFAHIWIYNKGKFYHSTMNGSVLHPAWWVAVDMKQYIEKTKPRWCLVMRTEKEWWMVWQKAEEMITTWKVEYDQFWAIADTQWWSSGSDAKYNCGEFVWAVLEATTGIDVPDDKDALPWTYEKMPWLKPVYMDRYTW